MSNPDPSTQAPRTSLSPPPLPARETCWALLLDVDGTLLDFNDDPLAVEVGAPLLDLLHRLHDVLHGALALVSGRSLEDLDRLFGKPRRAAIGLHGLQLRHADGSFRRIEVAAAQRDRMQRCARVLADRFGGVMVEDKHWTVALHCLNTPEQWAELHCAARELLPDLPGYELQPGRRVIEFKPSGMNKGRAIDELLRRAPFAGRVPVYLGDDLTDEHAFAMANRRHGISVRVGSREPTLAHFTLPGPAQTELWLRQVLEAFHQGHSFHAEPAERHQRPP